MLPKHIWLINISGLLCNISTSLMYGISASFLRTVVGVNPGDIGLFQGLIDACSHGTKLSAGVISDFFQKRRLLILIGMALVVISKPILAITSSIGLVFCARALDRFGNGVQSTPRDALIGDLCPSEMRGRCYGLRNTLTVLGSFIGSLLGIQLMLWTGNDFRTIFFISAVPAFLAFVFAYFYVPDSFTLQKREKQKWQWSDLKIFDQSFWKFILVCFVFLIFRFNETVLVVRATESLGLSHAKSASILLMFNLALCSCSYPIGILSDRTSKEKILFFSLLLSCVAHFVCGYATSLTMFFAGVVLWGLQMGSSNSMFFTLVANYATLNLRGTAFSIFFFTCLLAAVAGSFMFRYLCNNYGLQIPFYVGSVGAFSSAILLLAFFKEKIFSSSKV